MVGIEWVGILWYILPHRMRTNTAPQIAQTVGENLRRARLAKDLTQKEVGDELGVTNRDVSRWENGAVEPGRKYRLLLADLLFDGDVSAMYAGEGLAA